MASSFAGETDPIADTAGELFDEDAGKKDFVGELVVGRTEMGKELLSGNVELEGKPGVKIIDPGMFVVVENKVALP